jgi:hypothetical protein
MDDKDPAVVWERIKYRLASKVSLRKVRYVMSRIEGPTHSVNKPQTVIGLAGIWPDLSRPYQIASWQVETPQGRVEGCRYELLVSGVDEAQADRNKKLCQQMARSLRVSSELITAQTDIATTWSQKGNALVAQLLELIDDQARELEMPHVFLLFKKIEGLPKPAVEIWHPSPMTSFMALTDLQYLAPRRARARN